MPSHDQGRERGGHDANRRDARQGAWWEANFVKNLLCSGVRQRQALSRACPAEREETGERVRTQGETPRPAPVGGQMKEVRKLPCQRGAQGADMGRMAALDAGFDVKASGVTLDRFCGSGITTVSLAAAQIMSGMEDCVIAGGCEMMSYTAATADPKVPPMMDAGNLHLRELHPQSQQGVCADAIATLEGIDREAVDQLAVTSQQRAKRAMDEGRFDKSLIPVYNRDGTLALDKDEFPRPSTTMESLSGLKTVFNMFMEVPVDDQGNTYGAMVTKKYPQLEGKMTHVHHAGNSSGVVDLSLIHI